MAEKENNNKSNTYMNSLMDSEGVYKLIIENAFDGIYLTRGKNYEFANKKFCEMVGFELEEITSPDFSLMSLLSPKSIELVQKRYEARLRGEELPSTYEIEIKKKDGSFLEVELSTVPIGKPEEARVLGIMRDIAQRKDAERLLIKSEKKFHSYFNTAPESIFVVNSKGNYIDVNPTACLITGYSKEELMQKEITDIFNLDSLLAGLEHFEKVNTVGTDSRELTIVSKYGDLVYISVDSVKINDDEFVSFCQNITPKKEYLVEISRLASIVESSDDAIIGYNIDGIITYWNNGAKYIFGYKPAEVIGQHISILFPDNYDDEHNYILRTTRQGLSIRHYETKRKRKDNTLIDVSITSSPIYDEDKNVIGTSSIARDIREQKNAESEIKLNEARLESLLKISQYDAESSQDLLDYALNEAISLTNSKIGFIFLYDDSLNEFELKSWSKEILTEFKVSDPKEFFNLKGLGVWEELFFDPKPMVNNNYFIKNYNSSNSNNILLKLRRYIIIPMMVSNQIVGVVAVANKDSDYNDSDIRQLNLLISAVWKILENKKVTEELRKALDKAEESDKLKSVFLANMSHELRTPLNGILGFSQILEDTDDIVEAQEIARIINSSGNRLLETLNLILDLSKIESNAFELVKSNINVNDCVKDAVVIQEPLAKHRDLTIEVIEKKNNIFLTTDERLLRQVVTNILNNAIKFTEKGKITIEIDKIFTDNIYHIQIKITDTGIGIPDKFFKTIFLPFRQASEGFNRQFEGTGLGLTLAKKTVELLNGNILLESNVGVGSSFSIVIPESYDLPNQKVEEPPTYDDFETGNNLPKLLIVDDDDTSLVLLKRIFNKSFIVATASNGIEAIELSKVETFDVILMDISLKGDLDGVQTQKRIREFPGYERVPIVAVTAHAMVGDKDIFIKEGFDHYFSKPYDIDYILSFIHSLVN